MQLMQVESSSSRSDHADLECGTRAEQRECGIGVGGYLPHSKIEGESEAVSDVTVPGTALLQRENDTTCMSFKTHFLFMPLSMEIGYILKNDLFIITVSCLCSCTPVTRARPARKFKH